MENNLSNLLFITVEDVKESKLWQPINDRKQSAYNDNLIYNAILKTSLWMDILSGGTIFDKINKKDLFPWVKKDNTGLIEYNKWLSYIQSTCLLAVINWYLPKGVNDLTGVVHHFHKVVLHIHKLMTLKQMKILPEMLKML